MRTSAVRKPKIVKTAIRGTSHFTDVPCPAAAAMPFSISKDTVSNQTTHVATAPASQRPDPVETKLEQEQGRPRLSSRDVVHAYVALTKPRIIELLLVTTLPVMFLASHGLPKLGLAIATMVGGLFAAASANVFNCVIDVDIDQKMRRTRRRPLPRHQVPRRSALIYGIILEIIATIILGSVSYTHLTLPTSDLL